MTDVNDNSPVFTQEEFRFTVPEANLLQVEIGSVGANDADEPFTPNSNIVYSILSGNEEGILSLGMYECHFKLSTT